MQYRGNFQNFFDTTLLPAISGTVWKKFNAKPKMGMRILDNESISKDITQKAAVAGVGLPSFVSEGADTPTDSFVQLPTKTFKPAKFGLGVGASKELVDDDQFGIITKRSAKLGESIAQSIEIQAASVLNNAFDASGFPGPDGVALCSISHPAYKAGGLRPNALAVAADLDITSLELALIDWELLITHEGFPQLLPTPRLLVAPQNRFNAFTITKSDMRSDTANNAVNAFKYTETGGRIEPMVWAYLTDPDAWFLVAPAGETEMLWVWRKKPYTASDYTERNETGIVYMRYRADFGFYGDRGIYGTPGA